MATAPRPLAGPPPLRIPKPPAALPRVAFAGLLGALRKREKPTTETGPTKKPALAQPDAPPTDPKPRPPELDTLDPLLRVLGTPYSATPLPPSPPPPSIGGAPAPKSTDAQLATSLERASDVLEKVALWGDGHSGVARLRFDARARAGLSAASVTLEHHDGVLSIHAEGADAESLEELRARLRARGIVVED
ncbi:MAG: hypothetical protein IPJ34_06500 [Myxococcales bacterium]|nr:hypothetical protein [Myxococcales bacterium]